MFESLSRFLTPMDVRSVRAYAQFKEGQMRYVSKHYMRFYHALGHESPGVRLLRYILQFLDYDYLDSRANNYQRYTDYMRFIRRDLMNTFDRVRQGRAFHNLFIERSQFLSEEYLYPIEDVNTIVNLPLDTNDWTVWRYVRPLRIWTHDSDELSMKMLHGQFGYTYFPPGYVIELLDVIALVFKYYIWYKFYRSKEQAQSLAYEAPQQLFIQKYVMCDLLWDQLDVWLFRNANRLYDAEDSTEVSKVFSAQSLQADPQYGRVDQSAGRGYLQLYNEVFNNAHMDYRTVLSVPLFCNSEAVSFIDRINLLHQKLMLPRLSDYTYLLWLRDKEALRFLTRTLSRTKAMSCVKVSMLRELTILMNRLIRQRPWQKMNNIILQNSIEDEINTFAANLNL